MTAPEMSQPLADLVFFALDHGINSIRDGGPLIPFLVYEEADKRALHRFAAQTLEESLARAKAATASLSGGVTASAIAYDGFVTIENRKFEAVIVEGAEQRKPRGVHLAQRYVPKRFLRRLRTVGNPTFLGECDSICKAVVITKHAARNEKAMRPRYALGSALPVR